MDHGCKVDVSSCAPLVNTESVGKGEKKGAEVHSTTCWMMGDHAMMTRY
jgi:hypothetical protein